MNNKSSQCKGVKESLCDRSLCVYVRPRFRRTHCRSRRFTKGEKTKQEKKTKKENSTKSSHFSDKNDDDDNSQAASILEDLKKRSVLYHHLADKTKRKELDQVLLSIFENDVTERIGSGNTKFAYGLSMHPEKIIKVVILDTDSLARFIREPIYMATHANICNKTTKMTLYIDHSNLDFIPNIPKHVTLTIRDHVELGDSIVMTWLEDKALVTDVDKMPDAAKKGAMTFKDVTSRQLDEDGFEDLGKVNIGFFSKAPKYRWIDIQPKEE